MLKLAMREQTTGLENQKQENMEKLLEQTEAKENGTATKGQINYNSVTISTMEDCLNKLLKKNKEYQAEITALKKTIKELNQQQTSSPKLKSPKYNQDVADNEKLVAKLKQENADYKQKIQDLESAVTGLKKDLAGTSAQLKAKTNEVSKDKKEEKERDRRVLDREAELLKCMQLNAKLTQTVDKKTQEVKELKGIITKQKSDLTKYKSQATEQETKVKELEEQLKSEQDEAQKHLDLLQEEGQVTSELTSLGAQCRGERHEQIISRQREALSELRGRIRNLEQTHTPLPSQDSALQHVILLKRELAEMRANQALNENQAIASSILEQQVNKARGIEPRSRAEADIERSAHRETMESLELSEGSFLTLLRVMSSALEMDKIDGLRSIAHIPKDERARLYSEREQSCEILANRIQVLKERIERKDELLQGYERDLAKLRQAEQLADHRQSQVENLSDEIRNKTEEAEYLRESLNRTREELDQEKRTSAAIKLKKVVQPDNGEKGGWKIHCCPKDDPTGRIAAKKREKNEVVKRKSYEIRTLKTELMNREKQLDLTMQKLSKFNAQYVSVEKLPST